MREIKFRAWNKEKKIMVYSNEDESASYRDGVNISDIDMVNYRLCKQHINIDTYIWNQYTGLKDKNGREIYEGDIVDSWADDVDETYIREVYFSKDSIGFDLLPGVGTTLCKNNAEKGCFEVIGNIYETPNQIEND